MIEMAEFEEHDHDQENIDEINMVNGYFEGDIDIIISNSDNECEVDVIQEENGLNDILMEMDKET